MRGKVRAQDLEESFGVRHREKDNQVRVPRRSHRHVKSERLGAIEAGEPFSLREPLKKAVHKGRQLRRSAAGENPANAVQEPVRSGHGQNNVRVIAM